jgi:hypothetical protein
LDVFSSWQLPSIRCVQYLNSCLCFGLFRTDSCFFTLLHSVKTVEFVISCHSRATIFLGWVSRGSLLWLTQIRPQKYTTMAHLQHGFATWICTPIPINILSRRVIHIYIFFSAPNQYLITCALPPLQEINYFVSCILCSSVMLKVPKHEIFDFDFFASKEPIWSPVT